MDGYGDLVIKAKPDCGLETHHPTLPYMVHTSLVGHYILGLGIL